MHVSQSLSSIGMLHFEPILALIWMHVSRLVTIHGKGGIVYHGTEPVDFIVALSRLCNGIDPLQILRLAENDAQCGIKKGFTDDYLSADFEEQKRLLYTFENTSNIEILQFAVDLLNLDIAVNRRWGIKQTSIVDLRNGLSSIVFSEDTIKEHLTMMIKYALSEENNTRIVLPMYLKEYCISRLEHWINNAFVAKQMKYGREYIVENNDIYPIDYKSTGVIEINKKWGEGLQQFLEMKHGLPMSPLSLITNFLSNIDLFERYGGNILGVSGTLGNDEERKFMNDTFSVDFTTIPPSKRRKLFELEGQILERGNTDWLDAISKQVHLAIKDNRAVLIICEDIATKNIIQTFIANKKSNSAICLYTNGSNDDEYHRKSALKPKDVVITTNLGARGSDFVTDDIVNKNGGLCVLLTFMPMNDRVEKQAFGRTARRGATGSCQILVNRGKMPEWSRGCETVDEAKRLRDSIEMQRADDMLRHKHALFQEYCELKLRFVNSSNCDLDDLKIQVELLDETWAKWIQEYEARMHGYRRDEMVQDLQQIMKECSELARSFDSDNIYHLLKFGAVRLMKRDFEGATNFYDRVILKDPAWSAFAHYNRAYCTIQMKSDRYIRRAIDDLTSTLRNLEMYKSTFLFSKVHAIETRMNETTYDHDDYDDEQNFKARAETSSRGMRAIRQFDVTINV